MMKQKTNTAQEAVMVATYRSECYGWLTSRQGKDGKLYYNLPFHGKDGDAVRYKAFDTAFLYSPDYSPIFVRIKYMGVVRATALAKQYGYPVSDHPHSDRYILFEQTEKLTLRDVRAKQKNPDTRFVVCLSERAKSKYIWSEFLENFLNQSRVQFANWARKNQVPEWLNKTVDHLPKVPGRISIQTDFFEQLMTEEKIEVPFPNPKKGKFTFIDLFAGIGGIRLGYQSLGGKCVFSSEWDEAAAKTYYYNFGERPHGDITKIDPATIPDFDILLGGFPCQPFSIIGDKEGFNHETQGTLFFNIEKILLVKKPKAFMLENVRNLTAHDGGRTFKVILAHLKKAGYDVHAKVLNALDYGVPQKRERIIICGFRKKVDFEFPPPIPVESRKTVADIIDAAAENDKSLFVRPAIRKSRLERIKDKSFPKPYISHENVAGSITPHNYSCALRAGASANYILVNDERRPSAREMLRIQGFPDEFKVVVNYSQIKHQTGNSVAVPVIRAVAERVVEKIKEL